MHQYAFPQKQYIDGELRGSSLQWSRTVRSHLIRPFEPLAGTAPGHGSFHHNQLVIGVLENGIQFVLPKEDVDKTRPRLQGAANMTEALTIFIHDGEEWHSMMKARLG